MTGNFLKFFSFLKKYGFLNTIFYAFYKIFPGSFLLLLSKGRGEVPIAENPVYDYTDWSSFGGAQKITGPPMAKKTFIWFVPDWSNVWGGGHYTLFRFANYFAQKDTRNIIYVYNNERHLSSNNLQTELNEALPDCRLEVYVDGRCLPECSAAIATTWQSAYQVRSFPFSKEKYYFMQDYECYFYPFGTTSLQAKTTYTFGFKGITGGGWLKHCFEMHGGKAQDYFFAADKEIFFPFREANFIRPKVKRIFFYGRPSTERRCFELGMKVLKKISENYPDVEIVIAGLKLAFKPNFQATLLGNMSLKDTGNLYRTCDIGIAFSATNLSYLPVELMACGVPVLSNNGPQVEWMLKNQVNSYLTDPVPQAVFDGFKKLYDDFDLRQMLGIGGVNTMKNITWDSEMEKIYHYINNE
ncbi:rhamnosyltransferase WsaF family glycosyltransferase [Leptospirillum ferrooxidans]|uniref:rhamnosyltransferase WsaF family glycosyltransferase n=1 Tax=Leptospirillum ferrooxidans TaxID=180 RepID=UPI0002DC1AFC|nr:glycosyltransferase [Leptospirillum ferrooxidans]